MVPLKRFVLLFAILALLALACKASIDLGTSQSSQQDFVATMVAQTLQALTQQAASATATATPVPTATPMTISVPATLSVSAATDCYAGPSRNYGFVITIRPGTVVTVVGKDSPDNVWIIDVPGYPGTVCWLSGQYAQVVGDTNNLPAPATPLPSRYTLSEPRNLHISCTESSSDSDDSSWDDDVEWTIVLRWTNTETEQIGVRIYRNGRRIDTLGPHASSYTEILSHHHGHHEVTYGVQAYNWSAVSSIVSVSLRHCD